MNRLTISIAVASFLLAGGVLARGAGFPARAAEPEEAEKVVAEPRADAALVYFVRPDTPPEDRWWIFDDRKPIAIVKQDSYAFAYLGPGPHLLWSRPTSATTVPLFGRRVLHVEAGKTYYVQLAETGEMLLKAFVLLTEDAGRTAVAEAKRFIRMTESEIEKGQRLAEKRYGGSVSAVARSSAPPSDTERAVKIPAGTAVRLELVENVTSFHAKLGGEVRLRVVEDLRVAGETIVRSGTLFSGRVGWLLRARSFGNPGFLDVEVAELKWPDGSVTPALGLLSSMGGEDLGGRVLGTAGQLGGFAPALGLSGLPGFFIRGGDAWLLAGMPLTAFTRHDASVVPEKLATKGAAETAPAPALPAVVAAPIGIPPKGRVQSEVTIHVASAAEPKDVVIDSVGGTRVPVSLVPLKTVKQDDGWDLVFSGWDLVRFARLGPNPTELQVVLRGLLPDGSLFSATVPIVYRVATSD